MKELLVELALAVHKSLSQINSWKKGILYIKRLEGNTGFSTSYVDFDDNEIKISAAATYKTHKAVKQLYKITQNHALPHKNWNRAIFTLYPDNKSEIEYIWDQELQDKIDGYNNKIGPMA